MSDTVYTYYDADNVVVFPSSNAKDDGKLTSEFLNLAAKKIDESGC